MAAIDDLTELVERAAAAEKSALASKWKDEPDVQSLIRRSRTAAEEQRQAVRLDTIRIGCPHAGRVCGERSRPWSPTRAAGPGALGAGAPRRRNVDGDGGGRHSAVESSGRGAGGAGRGGRGRGGPDGPDRCSAGRVAGQVGPHPGGRGPAGLGGDRRSRAAARSQRRQPDGPALADGVTGEIKYELTRKPRNTIKALAIALALGLLYLGYLRVFQWDRNQKWLPYLGLWVISFVMGGSVCINAMSFDAMRVRAALDSGARLWHLLVIKNLALLCIVSPVGFLLSALLAWRAGDLEAFFKACVLVICFILLWLGVGNVLSIWLPTRDEPIRQRRQSGSLKQFLIAFVAAYLIGYLVNLMLIWRVFAARALTERLGTAIIPAILIVLSCIGYVGAAHGVRGGACATAEGPPDAAEGDRRLPCERRGPRLRRRTGGRCSRAGRRGGTADLSLRRSAPRSPRGGRDSTTRRITDRVSNPPRAQSANQISATSAVVMGDPVECLGQLKRQRDSQVAERGGAVLPDGVVHEVAQSGQSELVVVIVGQHRVQSVQDSAPGGRIVDPVLHADPPRGRREGSTLRRKVSVISLVWW